MDKRVAVTVLVAAALAQVSCGSFGWKKVRNVQVSQIPPGTKASVRVLFIHTEAPTVLFQETSRTQCGRFIRETCRSRRRALKLHVRVGARRGPGLRLPSCNSSSKLNPETQTELKRVDPQWKH